MYTTSSRQTPSFGFSTLLNNGNISKEESTHLSKVYTVLGIMSICAVMGAYVNVVYHIGNLVMGILSVGLLIAFHMTRPSDDTFNGHAVRIGILAAFGFMKGLIVGPLVNSVLNMDGGEDIVLSAVSMTLAIFFCFTMTALWAERRSLLFIGGFIGSATIGLLFLAITNLFIQSPMLYNISIYMGLLVFSAYVIFDTQLILERFSLGDKDFSHHALQLFIDLVGLFVRILRVLSQKKKNERK
eukprot:TRINITY_DN7508_c0_g1_i1.p1 TRINITY_DN7508_c0_g1~~TRINITY_DN7508_c0_g1_i1.p1  ORF type:complete len:252 (+),score=41.88 TRINITY_DN7508_c0_g1_i1:31-756(+)